MGYLIAFILKFFFGIATRRFELSRVAKKATSPLPRQSPLLEAMERLDDEAQYRFVLPSSERGRFIAVLQTIQALSSASTAERSPIVPATFVSSFHASATKGKDSFRRALICSHRLGLNRPAATLATVGETFGVTRERVRQIVETTLQSMSGLPIYEAYRVCVDAALADHECVTAEELVLSNPFFAGIDPAGMRAILDVFFAGRSWTHRELRLVSRQPRSLIEGAIDNVCYSVDQLRVRRDIHSDILRIVSTELERIGLPRFRDTLITIATERASERFFSLTDFVRDCVDLSQATVKTANVIKAAQLEGFKTSEGQIRNAIASISGVYPLGHSEFGTYAQIFGFNEVDHSPQVNFLADLVSAIPSRQAHAEELFEQLSVAFPDASSGITDPFRLAAMLRERSDLHYLGRLVFAAIPHSERIGVEPVVIAVLTEAGRPLPFDEIVSRIRARRGLSRSSIQFITSLLTEVEPGLWNLASSQIENPQPQELEASHLDRSWPYQLSEPNLPSHFSTQVLQVEGV
jgi:hypothetical protein